MILASEIPLGMIMTLFEIDDGKLVCAQFGRKIKGNIPENILKSVREQVLQIIDFNLFPVSWIKTDELCAMPSDMPQNDVAQKRLVAFDNSGQLVIVEVVSILTSKALTDSLSFLSRVSNLPWRQIANFYPTGVQSFANDWMSFRDTNPVSTVSVPRLILVVDTVESSMRPALSILLESGIAIFELDMRIMSNGRKFLEVSRLANSAGKPSVENMLLAGSNVGYLESEFGSKTSTGNISKLEVSENNTPSDLHKNSALHNFSESDENNNYPKHSYSSNDKTNTGETYVESAKHGNRYSRRFERKVAHSKHKNSGSNFTTKPILNNEKLCDSTSLLKSSTCVKEDSALHTRSHSAPIDEPKTISSITNQEFVPVGFDAHGLAVISALSDEDKISLYMPSICKNGVFGFLKNGEIHAINAVFDDANKVYLAVADYFMITLDSRIHPNSGWDAIKLGAVNGPSITEAIREINYKGTMKI